MYYITFNDIPSGIYQSQVIDVVKYLSTLSNKEVKLIAFLPLSSFKENKKKIKTQLPSAKVLPIWAGITRWRKLRSLLKLVTNRKETAICRGPIATELSIGIFQKVVYDGRAAVQAEVEEFDVTGNEQLGLDFINAERKAVLQSDYRISVSNKLVEYWKREFGYEEADHVVIPCTLTSQASDVLSKKEDRNSIKLVYSGGTGPWQSFGLVTELIRKKLNSDSTISVLFLAKENDAIKKLVQEFPERCERKWLKHDEVFEALSNCDYGILVRNQNVTNYVASPVKFAEYLNAGLSVLISENLGDFTAFVKENDCGIVVESEVPELIPVSSVERKRLNELANQYFYKSSEKVQSSYVKMLRELNDLEK